MDTGGKKGFTRQGAMKAMLGTESNRALQGATIAMLNTRGNKVTRDNEGYAKYWDNKGFIGGMKAMLGIQGAVGNNHYA